MSDIAHLRKSYERAELSEEASHADPLHQFAQWFLVSPQSLTNLPHDLAPFGCGPHTPFMECFNGLCNDLLVAFLIRCIDGADFFSVNGREGMDNRALPIDPDSAC